MNELEKNLLYSEKSLQNNAIFIFVFFSVYLYYEIIQKCHCKIPINRILRFKDKNQIWCGKFTSFVFKRYQSQFARRSYKTGEVVEIWVLPFI